MKIKELSIRNFRGIGENEFTVKIDDDINVLLLVGPNGYGKSTFFDAIEWALTGKITRIQDLKDIDGKRFIYSAFLNFHDNSKQSERKAEVKVTLSDGTVIKRKNRVSSSRKYDYGESDFEYLEADGSVISQNIYLEKMVNSNYRETILFHDQFYYSHILGQDTINRFIRNCNGTDRQKTIFEMLGMKNYSELIDILNPKSGEYRKLTLEVRRRFQELEEEKKELSVLKTSLNNYLEKCNLKDIDALKLMVINEIRTLIDIIEKNGIELPQGSLDSLKAVDSNRISGVRDEINVLDFNISTLLQNSDALKKNYMIYKRNSLAIKLLKKLVEYNLSLEKLSYFKDNYVNIKFSWVEQKILGIYSKSRTKVLNMTEPIFSLMNGWTEKLHQLEFNYTRDNMITIRYLKFKAYSLLKTLINIDGYETYKSLYDRIENIHRHFKFALDEYLSAKKEYDKMYEEYQSKSSLDSGYKDFLNNQVEFINKNKEFIDEMQKCPLCYRGFQDNIGIEFPIKLSASTSTKLLEIISFVHTLGNTNMETLKKILDEKEKSFIEKETVLKNVISKIQIIISEVILQIEEKSKELESRKILLNKTIDNREKAYNRKCQLEKDKLERINETKNEYFKNFTDKIIPTDVIDAVVATIEKSITDIRSSIESSGIAVKDYKDGIALKVLIDELDGKVQDLGIIDVNDENIDNRIKVVSDNITVISEVKSQVDKIKKELLPEDFKDVFFNINEKESEYKKADEAFNEINSFHRKIEKLYIRLNEKTNEINEKYIEKNGIVCSLYKSINPHPFYRDLELKLVKNNSIEMMCQNEGDRFYLDYIFSSAQTNILALSIFLGFALQQKWSNLEQIFIDDPIQNMDDINILSFVDIIRSLYCSVTPYPKQIIMSTHDDKLAELFRRKFRFINLNILKFESYTEEGPIIKQYDKYLQPVM